MMLWLSCVAEPDGGEGRVVGGAAFVGDGGLAVGDVAAFGGAEGVVGEGDEAGAGEGVEEGVEVLAVFREGEFGEELAGGGAAVARAVRIARRSSRSLARVGASRSRWRRRAGRCRSGRRGGAVGGRRSAGRGRSCGRWCLRRRPSWGRSGRGGGNLGVVAGLPCADCRSQRVRTLPVTSKIAAP